VVSIVIASDSAYDLVISVAAGQPDSVDDVAAFSGMWHAPGPRAMALP